MVNIFSKIITSLIFPIIISVVVYYFETSKDRNKYEEVYSKIFAPIEKIKLENPEISEKIYILKIERIIYCNENYSLVPPYFVDKFMEYKNKKILITEFDKIIDNNTNELRKLLGMPYKIRTRYNSNLIYVKRDINIPFFIFLITLCIFSITFPISIMYPDSYAKIIQTMNIIENFFLLYMLGFFLLSIVLLIPILLVKYINKIISK